ncbi:acyl carrier protein [Amycolatopsis speibonae]|uniref:Acyl carrier protein n=1 Tax=Amycolatopsis speibonae TaxID=1450224 RepID=A0ABV7PD55_9PSEU
MNDDSRTMRLWLAERVSHRTGADLSRIHDDVPLTSYGLDSVAAVTIVVDIEERYEIVLDPETLWDYRTIDELADLVTARLNGTDLP